MNMSQTMKIITIPTQISPTYPDKNGRLFDKDAMDRVFRQRGYLRPNQKDRITITPIPIRFFIDVTDYCQVMQSGWEASRSDLNTDTFTINSDISDRELESMQVMYVNNRYYINIPLNKDTYEKHAEYLGKCQAHAICLGLKNIQGELMGAEDVLYFDIFPDK